MVRQIGTDASLLLRTKRERAIRPWSGARRCFPHVARVSRDAARRRLEGSGYASLALLGLPLAATTTGVSGNGWDVLPHEGVHYP